MMQQLPLGVRWRDNSVFETFVAGPNALLVEALQSPQATGAIWIWGAAGSGKSHLLQAACARAGELGRRAGYFPLGQQIALTSEALQGCETLALVCIDNIEAVSRDADWNRSLFGLYNGLVEQQGRLVVAANQPPSALTWSLPDLATRMGAALIVQLQPLGEAQQVEVLRVRARRRGLDLPEETAHYLLKRVPRDLPSLCALLETLDTASLASQRRLTIPFIKQVLGQR